MNASIRNISDTGQVLNYSDYALLQRLVHKFGDSALKKEMSMWLH